ncbi:hypothetical protein ACFOLF_06875 [Paenibacillus sepulcri]|uniref:Chemotaxis methyl-accepting receptor HlyB-like 4HB MCP domain-containing protein n=1 Tax=Paenibacillus sepulcri TaxID=359917 RepID=A0ABS7C2T5_9BACL|nr:hypothetical protein [Paenibacillus sepulcri]
MEEHQPKRPIFTPIVLLMLVISLIGNVFFVTKLIQHDKDDRVSRGMSIINAGNQAKLHVDAVQANVQKLLDNDAIDSRISTKTALQAAFKQAQSLIILLDQAGAASKEPFAFKNRNAQTFLSQVEQSTTMIGNHEGPLTEAERSYLQQLESWYTQLKTTIASFDEDTLSETSAQTILIDPKWVDMSRKLLDIMNEPASVMYQSGS